MNIILGTENLSAIAEKYTVLELETFLTEAGEEVTAYCFVDELPLNELMTLAELTELHAGLIRNYNKQNWNYCEQAINHLYGKWKGELDTFYDHLTTQIAQARSKDSDQALDSTV